MKEVFLRPERQSFLPQSTQKNDLKKSEIQKKLKKGRMFLPLFFMSSHSYLDMLNVTIFNFLANE